MKKIAITLAAIALLIAAFFSIKAYWPKKESWKEITIQKSAFRLLISASALVTPENKIQIISPVGGRIDSLLVTEGEAVKKGQILAWVSSTDRAALLDAARAEGEEAVKQWEDEYKPTPIISPADGVIVNRPVVLSQTINTSTAIFELSDHLIINANVDETDLAKVHVGQEAEVRVDPFPDLLVHCQVSRIAQQSTTANNINTYTVYLKPEKIPASFRSGMTATVNFIVLDKKEALTLPSWMANGSEKTEIEVSVKNPEGKPIKRKVLLGKSDGESVEIVSGLKENETVLYQPQKVLSEVSNSSSPFMPSRAKKKL